MQTTPKVHPNQSGTPCWP